jgi:hypothetical protein
VFLARVVLTLGTNITIYLARDENTSSDLMPLNEIRIDAKQAGIQAHDSLCVSHQVLNFNFPNYQVLITLEQRYLEVGK